MVGRGAAQPAVKSPAAQLKAISDTLIANAPLLPSMANTRARALKLLDQGGRLLVIVLFCALPAAMLLVAGTAAFMYGLTEVARMFVWHVDEGLLLVALIFSAITFGLHGAWPLLRPFKDLGVSIWSARGWAEVVEAYLRPVLPDDERLAHANDDV